MKFMPCISRDCCRLSLIPHTTNQIDVSDDDNGNNHNGDGDGCHRNEIIAEKEREKNREKNRERRRQREERINRCGHGGLYIRGRRK